jgi:nucleotide-binding universal stress UspA family protein
MKKILVCLNASPNAQAIMSAAGYFAKLNPDFILEVLHVLKPSDNLDMIDYSAMMGMDSTGRFLDTLVDLDAKKSKVAYERGDVILQNAIDYIKNCHYIPDNQIIRTLKKGYFTDVVNHYEAESMFTILGKHGENSFKNGRLVGAHLETIIRSHTKPVLVACQNFSPLSKPLIAFDNSTRSHRAIDFIIANLKNHIRHLDVISINDFDTKISQKDLDNLQEKLLTHNINSNIILAQGDIIDVIDSTITNGFYDILFAGAYSHTQMHSVLFGSTTHNLLTKTNISLFLFP